MKSLFFDFTIYLTLLVCLCACTHRNTENKDRKIFVYNESTGIPTLDPAFSSGQSVIWACNQLYNGLVQLDDSMNIKPCIARSWNISEDGKTYTFYLLTDVKFHQTDFYPFKQPRYVKASDFVYSFERIINPKTASQGAWIFGYLASEDALTAVNDSVLKICLKSTFPPFLGILAMPYCSVVPRE